MTQETAKNILNNYLLATASIFSIDRIKNTVFYKQKNKEICNLWLKQLEAQLDTKYVTLFNEIDHQEMFAYIDDFFKDILELDADNLFRIAGLVKIAKDNPERFLEICKKEKIEIEQKNI